MSAAPIRLLIVDDHPVLRAGLRTIQEMAADICIVGEASTGEAALALADSIGADVMLLDIRLQGQNGIEICSQLKARHPELRVLFLTSYADEELILAALEAGADGYLLKENDTRRLVDAIREVARGGGVFDPQVTRRLASAKNQPSNALSSLTAQERRLLAEVALGKTDKEVAVMLGLTPKTARNYLDRIFTKLNIHTRTEAAMLYARSTKSDRLSQ